MPSESPVFARICAGAPSPKPQHITPVPRILVAAMHRKGVDHLVGVDALVGMKTYLSPNLWLLMFVWNGDLELKSLFVKIPPK